MKKRTKSQREGDVSRPRKSDPEIIRTKEEEKTPVAGDESREAGAVSIVPAEPAPVSRYDPLKAYIRKVRETPELSKEQELDLARRYRDLRDADAARQLVIANLALVVKIALMFRRAVANALDLIQEGNIGLLQAVERFDPEMGVRFPTYAAWWVKAYILKYLLDNARMVRVGTTNARRKLIYNLQKEKARLDAMGFSTGPKLLAEHFGVSEQDVIDVQATLEAGDVPLDAPIAEGEEKSRITLLPDPGESIEERVARSQLQELVNRKISKFSKTLNEKDRAILDLRLIAEEPATLQQIGDRFSVTREAIRQAEERLLRRLKDYLRDELGRDVLLQFRR
jgi:RNA polymerase sigma-32 factor